MATYTYDETWPTPKDEARHLLGDTLVTPGTTTIPAELALRSDEAITTALTRGGFYLGVAVLAEGLVTEFSQRPKRVTLPNGLMIDYGDRVPGWEKLAVRMRALAAAATTSTAAAESGGIATEGVW